MRSDNVGPLYLHSQEDYLDKHPSSADWDLKEWNYLRNSYHRHIIEMVHPSLQGARVYLMDDRSDDQVLIQEWHRP